MPTTVRQALHAAALEPFGVVPWGEVPEPSGPGVYAVALTSVTDSLAEAVSEAPLYEEAIDRWLVVRPELTLDGRRPAEQELANRVAAFWLPDEVIVYIGKASSLSRRVADYYSTPLGARRPHAGGYFLKLLENLDGLFVHYALCEDPVQAEDRMLEAFCARVSELSLRQLLDPKHPFPFANLEWPPGTRKAHGLRGAREPRGPKATGETAAAVARTKGVAQPGLAPPIAYRTQRVTAADLRAGQIRIPVSGPTKTLFPSERGPVLVTLRGTSLGTRWDPRVGPDHERSGVLRFADREALRGLVVPDEVLRVASAQGAEVRID